MIDKRRLSILAVLGGGLLLTLIFVVPARQGSSDADSETSETADNDVPGRQLDGKSGGGIRARSVDSAARLEFDEREPKEWAALGSEGRIARTEQQLETLTEQISASDNPETQALLRDRALTVLSWARADYFADANDRARYEAHEHAFESP